MTPQQLALSVKPDATKDWIDGFVTMYFRAYNKKSMQKPVDIYYNGSKTTVSSLIEASNNTGISVSRVCNLLRGGGVSRKGYSFRYGKKELKSQR